MLQSIVLLELLASGEMHGADYALSLQIQTCLKISFNFLPGPVVNDLEQSDTKRLLSQIALFSIRHQSWSPKRRQLLRLHDLNGAKSGTHRSAILGARKWAADQGLASALDVGIEGSPSGEMLLAKLTDGKALIHKIPGFIMMGPMHMHGMNLRAVPSEGTDQICAEVTQGTLIEWSIKTGLCSAKV